MGNLATLQPILSPMLWNSVATGKLADKHGIHGFVEPNPTGKGARPLLQHQSQVQSACGTSSISSGCGATSSAGGPVIPPSRSTGRSSPIASTAPSSRRKRAGRPPRARYTLSRKVPQLAPLKVLPQELSHEHIFPFIPHADRDRPGERSPPQAFAKVFTDCCSTHAVATAIMEQEPWDFTAIYYDTIDHFAHAFHAVPSTTNGEHPRRQVRNLQGRDERRVSLSRHDARAIAGTCRRRLYGHPLLRSRLSFATSPPAWRCLANRPVRPSGIASLASSR